MACSTNRPSCSARLHGQPNLVYHRAGFRTKVAPDIEGLGGLLNQHAEAVGYGPRGVVGGPAHKRRWFGAVEHVVTAAALGEQGGGEVGHLAGEVSLDDAIEQTKKNTRRLAKGQRTWFKTFRTVRWLDIEPEESAESIFARAQTLVI